MLRPLCVRRWRAGEASANRVDKRCPFLRGPVTEVEHVQAAQGRRDGLAQLTAELLRRVHEHVPVIAFEPGKHQQPAKPWVLNRQA